MWLSERATTSKILYAYFLRQFTPVPSLDRSVSQKRSRADIAYLRPRFDTRTDGISPLFVMLDKVLGDIAKRRAASRGVTNNAPVPELNAEIAEGSPVPAWDGDEDIDGIVITREKEIDPRTLSQ